MTFDPVRDRRAVQCRHCGATLVSTPTLSTVVFELPYHGPAHRAPVCPVGTLDTPVPVACSPRCLVTWQHTQAPSTHA
ncbi:hypothetical protein [Halomarina oriensis]|uniref:Uncharacterized protein n=1 Tax=Halomarina oriensis TaxID=671145 RepID=A0A6B0GNW9_9EURY|nr:hypothetical protein [Halomarina oriensis]MWG36502.1 hypothetical protein [Halomarina oriensis]